MTLNETQILMILGSTGVLLITITALIQFAYSKIEEYQENIRTKELLNIHYLSVQGNYQISALYNLLASFDPTKLQISSTEIKNNFEEAMSGKNELGKMAIRKAGEINSLREIGTPWTKVKNISQTIQISLIVINFIGYVYLIILSST